MTISDRREREKQLRRESIVDAAEKLFFYKGVAAATMDEIAEAAELSKGTIYLYFKNKECLYAAVVVRAMVLLKNLLREATGTVSTGLEKLDALGRTIIQFHENHPDYFTVLFYHHDNPLIEIDPNNLNLTEWIPEIMKEGNELFEMGVETIKLGIADSTAIRPDLDPCLAAMAVHTFLVGLIRIGFHRRKIHVEKNRHHGNRLHRLFLRSDQKVSRRSQGRGPSVTSRRNP